MMAQDPEQLSTAELRTLLRERTKQEKAAREEARTHYARDRDAYVDRIFARMQVLSVELKAFKETSVAEGLALHERMYAAHGRTKKRDLDHYSLVSADGLRKVVVERQYRCAYDETSSAAIDTIREVLRSKFEGRHKGLYAIMDGILIKNNKGDYDERLVARLRKHEAAVNDPRFSEALDLLGRAYRPTTSQTYVRAYCKGPTGSWQDVVMNWSSL